MCPAKCPSGQTCGLSGTLGPGDCTTMPCPLGSYCSSLGPSAMCQPYLACEACNGDNGCCTSTAQCQAGEVCSGDVCVAGVCGPCTGAVDGGADPTCGPTATCNAGRCACGSEADCASGEACLSSGLCGPCQTASDCATGQACLGGACGSCTTFEDCNTFSGFNPPAGLTCIGGMCTNCTANSQCAGGQACVGGTCGTCVIDSQCGPTGQCTAGFCACADDAQCASGQACGFGVCVPM